MTFNEKPFHPEQLHALLTPEELHSLLTPEEQETLNRRSGAGATMRSELPEDSERRIISELLRQIAELTERVELLELRLTMYAESSSGTFKRAASTEQAESAAGAQSPTTGTGANAASVTEPATTKLPSRMETYGSRKKRP